MDARTSVDPFSCDLCPTTVGLSSIFVSLRFFMSHQIIPSILPSAQVRPRKKVSRFFSLLSLEPVALISCYEAIQFCFAGPLS